jgi:Cu2+-exporting ATPase
MTQVSILCWVLLELNCFFPKQLKAMDYQIVHRIPGHIRVRVPLLAIEPELAHKLQGLIESLKFVTQVRINPWAESVVVSYKANIISPEVAEAQIIHVFQPVVPPETHFIVSAPVNVPLDQEVVPEPEVEKAIPTGVSGTSELEPLAEATPPELKLKLNVRARSLGNGWVSKCGFSGGFG